MVLQPVLRSRRVCKHLIVHEKPKFFIHDATLIQVKSSSGRKWRKRAGRMKRRDEDDDDGPIERQLELFVVATPDKNEFSQGFVVSSSLFARLQDCPGISHFRERLCVFFLPFLCF